MINLYNLLSISPFNSQLFYDGYQSIAHQLSGAIQLNLNHLASPPSDRLAHLVGLGLKTEGENKEQESLLAPPISGIDLDFDTESHCSAPEPSTYETVYVTAHKGNILQ